MRFLTPAEISALSGASVPMAVLVEMDLQQPVYLNSANIDLTIGSLTYLGTRGLGKIDPVRDTDAEVASLRFEMSGVPPSHIALADSEDVQGKAVRIKVALFDPQTYAILGTRLRWAGRLDVLRIIDGPESGTLECTAEHAGIGLIRPGVSLYSDAEQQRLFPGDLFFQFNADQVEQRIVWPAASWGRK